MEMESKLLFREELDTLRRLRNQALTFTARNEALRGVWRRSGRISIRHRQKHSSRRLIRRCERYVFFVVG